MTKSISAVRDAGRGQALKVGLAFHHVPEGETGARLVVPDAAIDQDGVMRRTHKVRLHADDEFTGRRLDRPRLKPGSVLVVKLRRQAGEELENVEQRLLLLDYRRQRDLAKRETFAHRLSHF